MTVQLLSLDHCHHAETRPAFIEGLISSLSETGFVRIENHGLQLDHLERAYTQCKALFDLPLEQKRKYELEKLGVRGYTGFGKETAKGETYSDLKEFWHIGKDLDEESPYFSVYENNLWPAELPEFQPCFATLFSQLEKVALDILLAIGEGFGVKETYFPSLIADGNSILRLIHYPPTSGYDTANRMRAAAHADINLMTLLVGATDSGLQLLDKEDNWVDVETGSNEIVVDTGDMMALITGNTLPATIHRVINPDQSTTARYSMPFFLHPHNDAVLEPQEEFGGTSSATPITAGDFLQQRLSENGLA